MHIPNPDNNTITSFIYLFIYSVLNIPHLGENEEQDDTIWRWLA